MDEQTGMEKACSCSVGMEQLRNGENEENWEKEEKEQ